MAVSDFMNRTLSPALKKYATPIQRAILRVAQDFLNRDYELIKNLPEIKRPDLVYDHTLTEVGSIYTYLDDTGKTWSKSDVVLNTSDNTYSVNPDSLDVLTSQETLYLIPTVSLSDYQIKTPQVEESSYPMYQVDGYSVYANHSQVLDALAADYGFTVRTDATLEEQVKILSDIAYLYRLRGSLWSIEHMKDLYGGNLPSPVDVAIPSYNLFRYSISEYDKTDKYQDGDANQPGTYEVWIYNWPGNIDELYEWMHDELVMAGAKIYIRDKILTGRTLEDTDDGVVQLDTKYPLSRVYDSRLYIDVVDTSGQIVALKPVDEFYYVKHIPETGSCRVLKNEIIGSMPSYAVDIIDTDLSVKYAFTSSINQNPDPLDWNDVVSLIAFAQQDESKPVLWLKLSSDTVQPHEVPVIVVKEGVDWYIVYRKTESGITEWLDWTSEDAIDSERLIITTDAESAEGILVRASLEGLKYPLCTYNKVEVRSTINIISIESADWGTLEDLEVTWADVEPYTWSELDADQSEGITLTRPLASEIGYGIMRSAKYSDSGKDEYKSLGTLLATVEDVGPIIRSKNLTDVLEVVMMKGA